MSRSVVVPAFLACVLAACLNGCVEPKIPEGKAVALVEQQPRNLDPLQTTDAVSQKINNLWHASLLRFDAKLRLEGELAMSWAHQGYRRFQFRLRPGLRFHDGSPLRADDVVQAMSLYLKGTPHAAAFQAVKRVWSEGEHEVWIETDRPQPFLLNDMPLVKIFKKKEGQIIGAGRYRLVAQTPAEVRLSIAETYHQPPASGALSELVFRYVADDTTRYQVLLRGEANAMLSALSLSKTRHLQANPPSGITIVDAGGVNYSYLAFNFRNPRLADLRVRQAIAHAIDIESVLRHRIGGFGYRSTGILAPAHSEYYEKEVIAYAHDPTKAERLLDEAGLRRGPTGWRFKLVFKTTSEKFGNEMARVLAGEIRKVGIDVRLQVVEPGTFFSEIKAGAFDLFHSRWVGVNSPAIYHRTFHSSQTPDKGGMNRGMYSNVEMDRLLDLGMKEVDDRVRRKYFSEIQRLAARDLPYVSLWHWHNTFIGAATMGNVVMYPNGDYRTFGDIRQSGASIR